MKRLGLVLAMSLVGSACLPATGAGADPLDVHRWTSRVVLVVAPASDDPRLADQRGLLAGAERGTAERDLVLVTAAGDDVTAIALRRRFGIPRDAFRAILVGKDGGAKLSSDRPISPARLFAEIDAMPMRRDEMIQRKR